MTAYGRHKQHPGNYKNCKLQKGHVMWWEIEIDKVKTKKRERQYSQYLIAYELLQLNDNG